MKRTLILAGILSAAGAEAPKAEQPKPRVNWDVVGPYRDIQNRLKDVQLQANQILQTLQEQVKETREAVKRDGCKDGIVDTTMLDRKPDGSGDQIVCLPKPILMPTSEAKKPNEQASPTSSK